MRDFEEVKSTVHCVPWSTDAKPDKLYDWQTTLTDSRNTITLGEITERLLK